jgi:nitrogen-specific signal transduction histidine kinase/ActR/RegA family two-component response regulator
VIGYGANVTELKEAQKALARSEERLLQAQKMEAVGRLAGGVAHDFNNLLTVIGGNVDLLRMEKDGDPLLDEVAEATARAAALTTQLLAFSRKQVVKLEQLDPDEVLAGVKMLLHRLIGEDVELVTDFGVCGRGCVTMDRGQLGQIVMNLAVNARDAMPHGGRLLIQTRLAPEAPVGRERHAHDGAWVVLEIGDTGTGMDALTRARIFEPFFTTKPTGEGTGLGLATVYAIVTEISGWIDVESEPGNGTTFRIWLPAHPVASPAPANEEEEEPSGSERILVVEDEPAVRALVVRLLEQVGYTVLAVSDPVSALAYFAPDLPSPDLLLTDVVLPGMNGRQLADQLRQTVGDLRVLFMSGYTDDAVVVRGVLSDEMAFVQKPFSRATLARAVREALDAPRPRWGRSGHERAAAWASRA